MQQNLTAQCYEILRRVAWPADHAAAWGVTKSSQDCAVFVAG